MRAVEAGREVFWKVQGPKAPARLPAVFSNFRRQNFRKRSRKFRLGTTKANLSKPTPASQTLKTLHLQVSWLAMT